MFLTINLGLLSSAMGLSEGVNPIEMWRERFRWLTPYYVASGPLAFVMAYAYDRLGILGLAAFALPPAFMMVSVRQYISHTSKSVEEIRRHNADLQELFDFAGGLAARAHDSEELRAYAEARLSTMLGAETHVSPEPTPGSIALQAGSETVGWLAFSFGETGDEQWLRLRDALVPQLATAFESAHLVDEVRQVEPRPRRRAVAEHGGEGLLHRRAHRAGGADHGRPRDTARLQRRGACGDGDRRARARHREDRDPGADPEQARPARATRSGR